MKKAYFIFCVLFFVTAFTYYGDYFFNNLMWSNKILYSSSQCDFIIPKGYALVVDENNEYAIRDLQYEGYYLYTGSHVQGMFATIAKPATFKDSCYAKGYLKKYLDEQAPKYTPRKP